MSLDKMQRGRTQALYKYLPDEWIDFSGRGNNHDQYIAKVDHWSSDKLEGINSKRLIRVVNQEIHSYMAQNKNNDSDVAPISGFEGDLTTENCDIRTPKEDAEDERGIVAKLDPLTFYCNECHKVYQFKSEEEYDRCNHRCENDGTLLSQFRQIYYCKCGYATSKQPVCPEHGASALYWEGDYRNYKLTCRKCGKQIDMHKICPECGEWLGPKSALDPSQYFAYSFNLIDLINEELEHFISETDYGAYITMAYWFGRIPKDEFESVISNGITDDPGQYQKTYEKCCQILEGSGLSKKDIENAARCMADQQCGKSYTQVIDDIKASIYDNEAVSSHAESILEYDMVRSVENQATLEKAAEVAISLNTNADPDCYMELAKKFGFSDVRACDGIPFITCSYGYTRIKTEYEPGVQLHAFKEERRGKKNVYAIKENTEGVLFEFDRRKILEWLLKNDFIPDDDNIPDLDSEEELKCWFINNINLGEITTFNEISEVDSKATYYVYRLIHSISHLLIRAAAEKGGLGKDSLSEYIFPDVPAVLIYVQNSQGFSLGSLFNTFEAYFDEWLNGANQDAQKCIYDPICIERYKACTGCLFLNEVSCQHFNKDLDRSLVIGHFDRRMKKRVYGFWEED